jgi:2-hydroxy-3-keto-5-methylthiopentenyl-1-phosphate phosphatase
MDGAHFTTGAREVLVSDFDGTMTRHDFYRLAIDRLLPADTPDYWVQYRAGEITHFEALRRYFAAIRATRDEVMSLVRDMRLDPALPEAVRRLREAGWTVVVTSAGCEWYIRELLTAAGVDVPVYANPGRFEEGRGLILERPARSPYLSENLGIDKAAVVRDFVQRGVKVAFAGDGFPDAEAARLVPGSLRFARGDLADVLRHERLEFQPFDRWSEIAAKLSPDREGEAGMKNTSN